MICFICGLDVAKVEIITEREEISFICSKCNSKRLAGQSNDSND